MAERITDTISGSFDYKDSYDDGNIPAIDLPGQHDGFDELPGRNRVSDECPGRHGIPDEVPRRDGPGGN